ELPVRCVEVRRRIRPAREERLKRLRVSEGRALRGGLCDRRLLVDSLAGGEPAEVEDRVDRLTKNLVGHDRILSASVQVCAERTRFALFHVTSPKICSILPRTRLRAGFLRHDFGGM